MSESKLRQSSFFICVYLVLPVILISLMLLGWRLAVENATVVLQAADSPDGRYRAEVVREDPGVSSGYEYMVRLMPAGLSPLAKSFRLGRLGPVYVALDAHREPDKLLVRWTGPEEVTIDCQGCGGARAGKARWRDVALRYEAN